MSAQKQPTAEELRKAAMIGFTVASGTPVFGNLSEEEVIKRASSYGQALQKRQERRDKIAGIVLEFAGKA